MASPFCLLKPKFTRFCSALLPRPALVEAVCSVWSIPLGTYELLMLFLFLCFTAGHLLVLLRVSTMPPNDAAGGTGQSAADDAVPPPEGHSTAPPARKTVLAVSCMMLLLGMLSFWVFADQERCLLPFFLSSTGAALPLLLFLLDSAKHRFNFGVLLVMLGSSGLIQLFVPGNGGSAELDLAEFELPLPFLLLLGLMGTLMLVSFTNPEMTFSFDFPGRCSTSPRPALTLVALSCAALVQLLVPTTMGSDGSVSGYLEIPVLILFLALMVSLVVVIVGITA